MISAKVKKDLEATDELANDLGNEEKKIDEANSPDKEKD